MSSLYIRSQPDNKCVESCDLITGAPAFTTEQDGSVSGSYTTGSGLTLAECYQYCSDGTWAGCLGFSRYSALADTATGSCWWVTSTTQYVMNDSNDNEQYPASHRTCALPRPTACF